MNIAVIGSGIAGLGAAWLLGQRHRVTLYEAEGRLGGHTHTVDVELEGRRAPVDTGFLVFNDRTYPNLIALFEHLRVPWTESDMSFSVRIDDLDLEWSGTNLNAVFSQRGNLVNPRFWGMLKDILRFNREARALAADPAADNRSLRHFLEDGDYGAPFRDWYLLPMSGAIWSCPTGQMLEFPASSLARFFLNHGLLDLAGRPRWRTVLGGGRAYVERLLAGIHEVRRGQPVRAIRRMPDRAQVETAEGTSSYDHIVLACHSDQALALLDAPTAAERDILGAIRYQPNRAVLHTDASLLPRAPTAWAAWNYRAGRGEPESRPVSVSYLINRLQPVPFQRPVIVTLNPDRDPEPGSVIRTIDYAHPVFDEPAVRAQQRLPEIQGRGNVWFAGAWTGYGFHEDGLRSAVAVANRLGVLAPWQQAAAQREAS